MNRNPWSREELIFALSLYFKIPFGKLNDTNPEIMEAARILGRTPAAFTMKLCNFARLDPSHMARNVKGLGHGGKQDEVIWREFYGNWEILSEQSALAQGQFDSAAVMPRTRITTAEKFESRKTETTAEMKQRIGQDFFRRLVLSNFNNSCAITGVSMTSLLIASHIIPWAKDESKRVNPSNGICLSAIHDRAFDKGFITLDEGLRVVLSNSLRRESTRNDFIKRCFADFEGKRIGVPERFELDAEAIEFHRENVFGREQLVEERQMATPLPKAPVDIGNEYSRLSNRCVRSL